MVSAANVRFPANAAQARRLGLTLLFRRSGERQNSVLRWARAETLRLDNRLTPEHDRLA